MTENSEENIAINPEEEVLLHTTRLEDAQILERLFREKGIPIDLKLDGKTVELFVKEKNLADAQTFLVAASSRVIHEKAKAKAIKEGKPLPSVIEDDLKMSDAPQKPKISLGAKIVMALLFLVLVAGVVFLTDFVIKLVQGLL